MVRLNKLLMSTDFDTLKNDGRAEASVTIPASVVVAGSSAVSYEATLDVGSPNSVVLVLCRSDVSGDFAATNWLQLSTPFIFNRTAQGGEAYNVTLLYSHVSGGVKVTCLISNPYGTSITLHNVTETWSFIVRSIKTPTFS